MVGRNKAGEKKIKRGVFKTTTLLLNQSEAWEAVAPPLLIWTVQLNSLRHLCHNCPLCVKIFDTSPLS